MSEEVEIDKLEKLIDRCNECKFATCENCEINWTEVQAIKGLLDLYKNLKEIEKFHKEENGKLRVELEQEKEKNMQLNEKNIMYKNSIPNQSNFYDFSNYISKDKLKFVLSKLNISDVEPWSTYKIDGQILFDLQELL